MGFVKGVSVRAQVCRGPPTLLASGLEGRGRGAHLDLPTRRFLLPKHGDWTDLDGTTLNLLNLVESILALEKSWGI